MKCVTREYTVWCDGCGSWVQMTGFEGVTTTKEAVEMARHRGLEDHKPWGGEVSRLQVQ
jgi:hypothetical protein